MTFLPVVERELRVAARRRGAYWSRFVAAMIGAALAAWVLLTVDDSDKEIGADLFAVVSTVVFLYAAVAGTLVTCDCLSEEKREGTLGLLFLTDLKGHDVVLGKLAATSVNAFYGMLAVLPMLAIPFVLGGVTWAEMSRVVLVSLNLLFFFLSIGLFASAVCRKDNSGLGLAILIGLVLVGTGPVVDCFTSFRHRDAVALSSPATGCLNAFDFMYTKNPPYGFWLNVALTHLYGWLFFGLACWIVPRSWRDATVDKKMRWGQATAPAQSAHTRTALLEDNPFLWRVARSGRKRRMVWLLLGALGLLWGCFPSYQMGLLLLVSAGFILKIWLAMEASRTLSEDRRSGGLELLLSTPLHEKDIVRGQLLALWRQFALAVGAVLLANLAFLIVEMRWDSDDRAVLLKLHLMFGGFMVTDMIALSWVGMWLGLLHRKSNRAALLALVRILVLPVACFSVLISLWAMEAVNYLSGAVYWFWIIPGLAADIFFGVAARAKLRDHFRTIVSEGVIRRSPPMEEAP